MSGEWKLQLRSFPCHSIVRGKCTCGTECGSNAGKHPVQKGWQQIATNDPKTVNQWCDDANVNLAICTGRESGIFVLDIDPKHNGFESLLQLTTEYGALPATYTVKTGGAGEHRYFKHPGFQVPNSASTLGVGLDVRGDGGYVMAPGARHKSGNKYESLGGELAEAPDWLLHLLLEKKTARVEIPESGIAEGTRNETLYKVASSLRRTGLSREAIFAALRIENKNKCHPPLPEFELSNISAQAAKFNPGRLPEVIDPDSYLELFHAYEEMVNAPPLRFVIQDFLQADGATMIGGLSGHGKTLIMVAIVKALLEGSTLFDHFKVLEPAKRVIYLIPEVPLGPFFHRLSKIFRLDEYLRDRRLLIRTLSKGPAVSLIDSRILKAAEGADVFLDTAIRFMEGDENQASDNQNGLAKHIFQLTAAGARTVVGAHHSPKNLEGQTRLTLENVLRGSGDIGAMLATCWAVRQQNPVTNRIWVQNVKPRDFTPPEPFVIEGRPHLDNTGYFLLASRPGEAGTLADNRPKPGRPADPGKEEKQQRVLALKREGKSEREIEKETGIPRGTVHRLITAKVIDGSDAAESVF
jgi:Bifunctional DNA primase/polymerase, N-terminal/AAA domain/Primase C terminal 1 (PriCT-1)